MTTLLKSTNRMLKGGMFVGKEFVAVERVKKYCNLEPEANADGSADPPFGWPCQGVISFKGAFLKYRYDTLRHTRRGCL